MVCFEHGQQFVEMMMKWLEGFICEHQEESIINQSFRQNLPWKSCNEWFVYLIVFVPKIIGITRKINQSPNGIDGFN
jgi:hypothetical protein